MQLGHEEDDKIDATQYACIAVMAVTVSMYKILEVAVGTTNGRLCQMVILATCMAIYMKAFDEHDQAKISVGVAGFDDVGQGLVSGINHNHRTKLAWIWDSAGLDDYELSEREKLAELKEFEKKGQVESVGVCDGAVLAEHGAALLKAADIVLCDATPLADALLRQRLLDAAAGSGRQIRIAVNVDAGGFGQSGFKQKPKMPKVLFEKKENEEEKLKREDEERRCDFLRISADLALFLDRFWVHL